MIKVFFFNCLRCLSVASGNPFLSGICVLFNVISMFQNYCLLGRVFFTPIFNILWASGYEFDYSIRTCGSFCWRIVQEMRSLGCQDAYLFLLRVSYVVPLVITEMRGCQFSSVQSLSRVRLFVTPWIAARQASLSITNSRSSLKLTSIQSVMPSSHLILCRPLLLLPPIPPSTRIFSNESTLRMRWPKYWSFSFSIIPSKEHPGLISFRMDWLDLLVVHRTLRSLRGCLYVLVNCSCHW